MTDQKPKLKFHDISKWGSNFPGIQGDFNIEDDPFDRANCDNN